MPADSSSPQVSQTRYLDLDDPFDAMLWKMKRMHDEKGHDYGDEDEYANIRASKEFSIPPWQGVALRMNDKMQRLKKFARVGRLKVKDESVKDTFIDLAVYAIIGYIMFEQEPDVSVHPGGIVTQNEAPDNTWYREIKE